MRSATRLTFRRALHAAPFALACGFCVGAAGCAPRGRPAGDVTRAEAGAVDGARPGTDAVGASRALVESAVARDACVILPGSARRGGAIVVGLTDHVDPSHAPVPWNDSERIVFRNLYETLVTLDCEGRTRPGLAESWAADDSGRVWSFTLRADATWWDGTPVDATDVKLAWIASRRRVGSPAAQEARLWSLLELPPDSVTVLDERRLVVRLPGRAGDSPAFFADPALAVADRRRGAAWPTGTGSARIPDAMVISEDDADTPDFVCVPSDTGSDRRPPWEQLVFRARPGWDPRDLPEQGVDALVVRDRELSEFFAGGDEFVDVSLPWDRLYVLVSSSDWLRGEVAASRSELARDVAASDAAPARTLEFLCAPADAASDDLRSRDAESPPDGSPLSLPRVAYLRSDADARRIAERAVAIVTGSSLAGSSGPDREPRTVGLSSDHLNEALADRGGASLVIRIDRVSAADCGRLSAILDARRATAVPLLATRPHLAARRGLAGVRVDWDGALQFDAAGWTDSAASASGGAALADSAGADTDTSAP